MALIRRRKYRYL